MSQSNGVLLKQVLQLAEEDNLNERLSTLLDRSISEMSFKSNNRLDISFYNGISVIITYNFDMYNMYISEPRFYTNDETAYSPMGIDRISRYLKQIAHYKM